MTHTAVRVRYAHHFFGSESMLVELNGTGCAGDDQVGRYAVVSLRNRSGSHGLLSRVASLSSRRKSLDAQAAERLCALQCSDDTSREEAPESQELTTPKSRRRKRRLRRLTNLRV